VRTRVATQLDEAAALDVVRADGEATGRQPSKATLAALRAVLRSATALTLVADDDGRSSAARRRAARPELQLSLLCVEPEQPPAAGGPGARTAPCSSGTRRSWRRRGLMRSGACSPASRPRPGWVHERRPLPRRERGAVAGVARRARRDSRGVWLVTWKKASGRPVLTYEDAVTEALAFGLGGQQGRQGRRRPHDAVVHRAPARQRLGPPNKRRIEALEADGRMTDAGRRVVEAAKADGAGRCSTTSRTSSCRPTSRRLRRGARLARAVGGVPALGQARDPRVGRAGQDRADRAKRIAETAEQAGRASAPTSGGAD
jgi:hypothetical protein